MYRIEAKKVLNSSVTQMEIFAPKVAAKALAGQFIILRTDAEGERIPLTIAGANPETGLVTIIFQTVGGTTAQLASMEEGEFLCDFVGPLGRPTETEGISRVCIVGGGVGCAIALPVARAFHTLGAEVTSIIGFRNSSLLILEEEFKACSDHLIVMTDDGSYGRHGNVTIPLKELLSCGNGKQPFDMVITIGPLIMMKYVVETVRPFGVPVTVSMNPIMIDGTGMCGGCRLTLLQNEKRVMKFACVDGPDFNGYEVDFDEAITRNRAYLDFERHAYEDRCNLLRGGD